MARTKGAIALKDDVFYMKATVKEGRKSMEKGLGLPFGAIVVKDN